MMLAKDCLYHNKPLFLSGDIGIELIQQYEIQYFKCLFYSKAKIFFSNCCC